jgi:hypothetical protein
LLFVTAGGKYSVDWFLRPKETTHNQTVWRTS